MWPVRALRAHPLSRLPAKTPCGGLPAPFPTSPHPKGPRGRGRERLRHGRVVIGAVIRPVGHRWQPSLAIPYTAFGRHQVVIGSSGSGKTNLMIRTWAGWYAAARSAHHRRGQPRPLLVVLDCKGGPDARAKAARTRRLLHAVGVGRVAVWPDDTSVSLWGLPPRELAVTLFQMV